MTERILCEKHGELKEDERYSVVTPDSRNPIWFCNYCRKKTTKKIVDGIRMVWVVIPPYIPSLSGE